MADGREFKIRITTEADTSAANKTADALKGVGEAGRKAYADDLDPALANATKSTEKLTESKTELRHIIRHITGEAPLLGAALRLAVTPLVGGVTVLVLLLKSLQSVFDGIQEHLKSGIGGPGFSGGMD